MEDLVIDTNLPGDLKDYKMLQEHVDLLIVSKTSGLTKEDKYEKKKLSEDIFHDEQKQSDQVTKW